MLLKIAAYLLSKKILDIGFGRGELLQYCYDKGALKCIGIDFSKAAYNIAFKYCNTEIKLYLSSISQIDKISENNFNIVFMLDIIEHITDEELINFLNKIQKKINIDTEFLITSPIDIKKGDFRNMHINQWNEKKINKILGKYFSQIEIKLKPETQFFIICKSYIKNNSLNNKNSV